MPKKNELEKDIIKAEAKKTTAKAKTKKADNKKTTVKKETTKKTVAKRAETKKTTPKKTETKKRTPKKSEEKKTETKKVTPTKTTAKRATSKKTEEKEMKIDKKVATKKVETKKRTSKKGVEVKAEKTKDTVVKRKIEKLENLEKKEKQIKEKVDEATVIEKIKNFLSKIIAMQEDSADEELEVTKTKTKKTAAKKTKKASPEYLLEYYDLPYRYNETTVKILAQTPKRLFVYWDISDKDREKYIKAFGDDFFYKTYPVLLLYNEDKKYTQEIPINDFANSWYIDIQDPKNKYTIQLGRKFIDEPQVVNMSAFHEESIILRTDYLPFADSNKLEVPNDHVLLELLPRFLTFRNVKTNEEVTKDLRSFKDVFGISYDIVKFYKEEYKNELSEEGMFDMANPSSALSSSSFR